MTAKPNPAWFDGETCRQCKRAPKASAWRFQVCPKCGFRGGATRPELTPWASGERRTATVPSAPREPSKAPQPVEPMSDGERAFADRARELARRVKGESS